MALLSSDVQSAVQELGGDAADLQPAHLGSVQLGDLLDRARPPDLVTLLRPDRDPSVAIGPNQPVTNQVAC